MTRLCVPLAISKCLCSRLAGETVRSTRDGETARSTRDGETARTTRDGETVKLERAQIMSDSSFHHHFPASLSHTPFSVLSDCNNVSCALCMLSCVCTFITWDSD